MSSLVISPCHPDYPEPRNSIEPGQNYRVLDLRVIRVVRVKLTGEPAPRLSAGIRGRGFLGLRVTPTSTWGSYGD